MCSKVDTMTTAIAMTFTQDMKSIRNDDIALKQLFKIVRIRQAAAQCQQAQIDLDQGSI